MRTDTHPLLSLRAVDLYIPVSVYILVRAVLVLSSFHSFCVLCLCSCVLILLTPSLSPPPLPSISSCFNATEQVVSYAKAHGVARSSYLHLHVHMLPLPWP